ncbi:MAG: hypothetical protein M1827_001909 [Pycnora praestabilis]|nr:MAG: hypothetical protein M1827_001909 [Pycnora praestabilis]
MGNYHTALLIVLWSTPFPTALILGLRLFARHFRPVAAFSTFGTTYEKWSTCMVIMSMLTSVTNTGLCLDSTYHGLGQRTGAVNASRSERAAHHLFIAQAFGISGAAFARISVAFYELAVFNVSAPRPPKGSRLWPRIRSTTTDHKVILWTNIVAQVVINGLCLAQVYWQCKPIQKLWDPLVEGTCESPEVQSVFGYVQGSVNTVTAFTLSILPGVKLFPLQMSRNNKIRLSILMGLGLVYGSRLRIRELDLTISLSDAIVSIIKTVLLDTVSQPGGLLYNISPLVLAWTFEQYLAIIAGSVPYLPRLFHKAPRHPDSSHASGIHYGTKRSQSLGDDDASDRDILSGQAASEGSFASTSVPLEEMLADRSGQPRAITKTTFISVKSEKKDEEAGGANNRSF